MSRPVRLGITAGDPAGIGPEIVARALAAGQLPPGATLLVWAEAETFDRACADAGLDPLPRATADADSGPALVPVDAGPVPDDFALGTPSAFTGRVAAAAVTDAEIGRAHV